MCDPTNYAECRNLIWDSPDYRLSHCITKNTKDDCMSCIRSNLGVDQSSVCSEEAIDNICEVPSTAIEDTPVYNGPADPLLAEQCRRYCVDFDTSRIRVCPGGQVQGGVGLIDLQIACEGPNAPCRIRNSTNVHGRLPLCIVDPNGVSVNPNYVQDIYTGTQEGNNGCRFSTDLPEDPGGVVTPLPQTHPVDPTPVVEGGLSQSEIQTRARDCFNGLASLNKDTKRALTGKTNNSSSECMVGLDNYFEKHGGEITTAGLVACHDEGTLNQQILQEVCNPNGVIRSQCSEHERSIIETSCYGSIFGGPYEDSNRDIHGPGSAGLDLDTYIDRITSQCNNPACAWDGLPTCMLENTQEGSPPVRPLLFPGEDSIPVYDYIENTQGWCNNDKRRGIFCNQIVNQSNTFNFQCEDAQYHLQTNKAGESWGGIDSTNGAEEGQCTNSDDDDGICSGNDNIIHTFFNSQLFDSASNTLIDNRVDFDATDDEYGAKASRAVRLHVDEIKWPELNELNEINTTWKGCKVLTAEEGDETNLNISAPTGKAYFDCTGAEAYGDNGTGIAYATYMCNGLESRLPVVSGVPCPRVVCDVSDNVIGNNYTNCVCNPSDSETGSYQSNRWQSIPDDKKVKMGDNIVGVLQLPNAGQTYSDVSWNLCKQNDPRDTPPGPDRQYVGDVVVSNYWKPRDKDEPLTCKDTADLTESRSDLYDYDIDVDKYIWCGEKENRDDYRTEKCESGEDCGLCSYSPRYVNGNNSGSNEGELEPCPCEYDEVDIREAALSKKQEMLDLMASQPIYYGNADNWDISAEELNHNLGNTDSDDLEFDDSWFGDPDWTTGRIFIDDDCFPPLGARYGTGCDYRFCKRKPEYDPPEEELPTTTSDRVPGGDDTGG